MLHKIMNAKSFVTPTQCMANKITQSCGFLLQGNWEGSLHQSKSGKTDCQCQLWKSVRARQGTPQPWPSEPWESDGRGKNLFICVVPPWDGQSHLQQSCCYSYTCLQWEGHPQLCTFDQFHIHRSGGLNFNWFLVCDFPFFFIPFSI